jgi:hypothetical protein
MLFSLHRYVTLLRWLQHHFHRMLSGSLELVPGSADYQPDPSWPQMLFRKVHPLQPCWPHQINFLLALTEDFSVYHRLVMAAILLPAWQMAKDDSVRASQRVRADSVRVAQRATAY